MGILRLLLAIAVLLDHAGPLFGFRLINGAMAVESFYMVSGFYMAMILSEKYKPAPGSYSLFITNRLLRLYPIYWVVLAATVAASALLYFWQGYPLKFAAYLDGPPLQPMTCVVLGLTQILLLGQDAILFLGLDARGALYWTSDFHQSHPAVYEYLFVHQAWTLGTEVLFYLLAPLMMRRQAWVLALLTAASIGVRLYTYRLGLRNDPWDYRFFPSELAFFFIGGIAYRAYCVLREKSVPLAVLRAAFGAVLLFTLLYQFLPATRLVQALYFLVFAVALPFNFQLTKKNRIDNKIGELSYPVYITHLLVLLLLHFAAPKLGLSQNMVTGCVLAFTLLVSKLLVDFVAEPIEKIRRRRVQKSIFSEAAGVTG